MEATIVGLLQGKIEEHLICFVCLGQLKNPKVLPCLHSYCHVCIINLARNANSNTINCPDCQFALKVDENTISSLPTNFFVNNILAKMALANYNSVAAKKITCDNCDGADVARCRCNECAMFLCQFCTESHKRSRSTKHHELWSVNRLKSGAIAQSMVTGYMRCPKHKSEVIKLFCKTCLATICRDCAIIDHRQHDYGFIEEEAVKEKQYLQQNLNEVMQSKVGITQEIVHLRKLNERLEVKKQSTISEIDLHFNELAQAVESGKKKMVEKATMLTNSKRRQVNTKLKALEKVLLTCDRGIKFTEQAFKSGNDAQILSMEKLILQSFEQLQTVKDQAEPHVTEDMVFITSSSAKETKEKLLNDYDIDIAVASPGNCKTVFNDETEILEAEKQYSIALICHDKCSRRLKYGGHDIKPWFTGMEVSDVTVTDNNDGSYIISFCPRQGGLLKFEAYINGVPAPKCALTRKVKWVIGDVYGKGVISNGGKAMRGVGGDGEYCCGVGACYFESGVHSWKVQLSPSATNMKPYNAEIGIIDCDDINANIANNKKKWVYARSFPGGCHPLILLTLDMDKKTVNIKATNLSNDGLVDAKNYQFTARRVSPFFAFKTPFVTLSIVK